MKESEKDKRVIEELKRFGFLTTEELAHVCKTDPAEIYGGPIRRLALDGTIYNNNGKWRLSHE